MKAEITKIKLQIKDRCIELTAQEAREVQAELNKLFDMEKSELQKFKEQWENEHQKTFPVPCPVPAPWAPIVIERQVPYWPRPWEVWCGTSENSGMLCMSIGQAT